MIALGNELRFRRSEACASGRGTVAGHVLGAAVAAAVAVVVPEVPCLTGADGSPAPGAADSAGLDGGAPCLAGVLVCGSVSALGGGASGLFDLAPVLEASVLALGVRTSGLAAHTHACSGHRHPPRVGGAGVAPAVRGTRSRRRLRLSSSASTRVRLRGWSGRACRRAARSWASVSMIWSNRLGIVSPPHAQESDEDAVAQSEHHGDSLGAVGMVIPGSCSSGARFVSPVVRMLWPSPRRLSRRARAGGWALTREVSRGPLACRSGVRGGGYDSGRVCDAHSSASGMNLTDDSGERTIDGSPRVFAWSRRCDRRRHRLGTAPGSSSVRGASV